MMTETLDVVSATTPTRKKRPGKPAKDADRDAVRALVRAARDRGEDLTGPDGLLRQLTKTVLETALDEEMSEHLGYDKHDPAGNNSGNSRNGTRAKTVLTDNVGPVEIEVPRDRDGSFEPVIVAKRARRLGEVDTIVLSLFAKGLTTGEIAAHFAEIYGAKVSKDTISRITDRVLDELEGWRSRPLQSVYAAVFIDAIMVKVRDGQVGNQPFYAAIGVDLAGRRDVLGLWPGSGGGESAKFWLAVLTEIKNRGVSDVFFLVCDGLKGLPDSVAAAFPQTIVQTCLIHLLRGTFRYASKKYWPQIAADMKPIYTAASPELARARYQEFAEKWGKPYPAIKTLWDNAWEQFTPFLDYDIEIRTVLCSTNAIESLNARFRRAVTVRGHFPTEQTASKTLYLVVRSLDPKGTGQARWTTRWKPASTRSPSPSPTACPTPRTSNHETAVYTGNRTVPVPDASWKFTSSSAKTAVREPSLFRYTVDRAARLATVEVATSKADFPDVAESRAAAPEVPGATATFESVERPPRVAVFVPPPGFGVGGGVGAASAS